MNALNITEDYVRVDEFRQAWETIKQERPHIRIREAAGLLNISEAQLLATGIGPDCIRLEGDWAKFVQRWKELGYVMSLTRNEGCVLEHKGTFDEINFFGGGSHRMGTVIGPIETRIFLKSWQVAFAVRQEMKGRTLESIQVFDKAGEAITKIYLQRKSNRDAYLQLIEDFKSENQTPEQAICLPETPEYNKNIDKEAFLSDWEQLKDTHSFFPMLRKHKAARLHAVQLAEGVFTQRIQLDAIQGLLEDAAKLEMPIMIFAGNRGNLQIHQDRVNKIVYMERGENPVNQWLNVLDPTFNMHLRMDLLETAWVVQKPTSDGLVTSIELFDKEGTLIVQFFGLRKPGEPQRQDWEALVEELPRI
ncbi:MAG: hemin-degrading factor [Flammeovirgaceae bacterium]